MRSIRVLGVAAIVSFAACSLAACSAFGNAGAEDALDAAAPDGGLATADGGADTGARVDADATPAADPSLVAHWKLDETAGDVAIDSIAMRNLTRTGGSWVQGKRDGAFSTGGSGYFQRPHDDALAVKDTFTVALWVNLGAQPQPSDDSYLFANGYAFSIKLNGRRPQLTFNSVGFYNVATTVSESAWHHLAVTFANGVTAIYVDGVAGTHDEGDLGGADRPSSTTDALVIGRAIDGSFNALGLIDDVRLYDRALSPAEIVVLAKP